MSAQTKEAIASVYLIDVATQKETPASERLTAFVNEAWKLRSQIKALESQLAAAEEYIKQTNASGTAIVIEGTARATISERQTIAIKNPDLLKSLVGARRYPDWVNTRYTAGKGLKDALSKPDTSWGQIAAQNTEIKTSISITWRAEK